MTHQKHRSVRERFLSVPHGPLHVAHAVRPARLAVRAPLAPLRVERSAPEPALVEGEDGEPPRGPRVVRVLVAPDVLDEAVDEHEHALRGRGGGGRGVEPGVEGRGVRPTQPGFSVGRHG